MANKSKTIAIVNQKGGVGKSTTAVNLGACLAQAGKRALLIDLDPQGNSTSGLGMAKGDREKCIYDALIGDVPISELIESAQTKGLFVVPATIHLAGAEIELVSMISRETRLKQVLELLEEVYNYIIIDCPPSLGLLTVNALTAADQLIIPIQCEYYALEGLSKLLESVRLIRKHLNPHLEIAGVLMTMHDARTKISQQVVDEVAKYFKDKVYKTIIPRTVRLSEAPSFGQPITTYDPKCVGAVAYQNFAKEVIKRG
ncbi:MAG TPA: ParA family protein [Actinobacteria bacterium]|nr:ParA family protein [Actinomycetota bacterium]